MHQAISYIRKVCMAARSSSRSTKKTVKSSAKSAVKSPSKTVKSETLPVTPSVTTAVSPATVESPVIVEPLSVMEVQRSPYSFTSFFNALRDNAGLIFIALSILIIGFLMGSIWTENKLLKTGSSGTGTTITADPVDPNAAPVQPTTATVDVGTLAFKGDKNAKIAIVEFADMRCPFCKQFVTDTKPQLVKDWVDTGKAKMYFRNYAFLGAASTLAANANECANEQGKFWQFYDYMYANQPAESDTTMYTNDNLAKIAGDLGMDKAKFTSCLTAAKYSGNLAKDLADGNQAGGGSMGTPSFVIGKIGADGKVSGALIVGALPYSTFKSTLEAIK